MKRNGRPLEGRHRWLLQILLAYGHQLILATFKIVLQDDCTDNGNAITVKYAKHRLSVDGAVRGLQKANNGDFFAWKPSIIGLRVWICTVQLRPCLKQAWLRQAEELLTFIKQILMTAWVTTVPLFDLSLFIRQAVSDSPGLIGLSLFVCC